MVQPEKITPFAFLQNLALQCGDSAVDKTEEASIDRAWRGIGFRMANQNFIVPMSEVEEVLYMPPYTNVPGVKDWLLGIANIRGRLLSLVDLPLFLGETPVLQSRDTRVIASKNDDLYTGILVEEVLGMQTFNEVELKQFKPENPSLLPFVKKAFEHQGDSWAIFSLLELGQSPEFLQVAI